jgi:hypothetical protein
MGNYKEVIKMILQILLMFIIISCYGGIAIFILLIPYTLNLPEYWFLLTIPIACLMIAPLALRVFSK